MSFLSCDWRSGNAGGSDVWHAAAFCSPPLPRLHLPDMESRQKPQSEDHRHFLKMPLRSIENVPRRGIASAAAFCARAKAFTL